MSVASFTSRVPAAVAVHPDSILSIPLKRTVHFEVVLPADFDPAASVAYPVLYLNDGQDLARLRLKGTLNTLYRQQAVRPFVLVAIHAGERIQEYGTAARPDFKARGSKAKQYAEFVLTELLPYVQGKYHVSADPEQAVFGGFSLGGLSAFDLVWHHPEAFARAGAFSGSFWWRSKAIEDGYLDSDRIMHQLVRHGQAHSSHRFWLQTGTLDETNDRNHNGIIDSIEDTLDLMAELTRHNIPDQHIRYVQMTGGRHDQQTWGRAMPDFLRWAFGALEGEQPRYGQSKAHLISNRNWASRRRLAKQRRKRVSEKNFLDYLAAPTPVVAAMNSQTRPVSGQYPVYYDESYYPRVPAGADPLELLEQQTAELQQLLGGLSEEQALTAYAPGKWSIKEMVQHLTDTERIFAYRALCIARGETQSLPGFDENTYAAESDANSRTLSELLAENEMVRKSSLALFRSFRPAQLDRVGLANNNPISVRALLYVLPGHEAHHINVLRERYLPLL
ncbi:alpha/beta hydrolase-fold protein [Hymenobacter sp. BT491]|uniref:alpha/beta hydrolase-fold protein n=1 Tax=Hymenobacter sp. BT491 TaxID=2766779 RepID=UPI00292A419E|nr:alpha/beta hydrolase-fold protein [Hymenobacter sp. BT491]